MIKKSPFKSLTLRIWTTFVIFVVILILCISFIYLFFVRIVTQTTQLENLEVTHHTLKEFMEQIPNFSPNTPPQFESGPQSAISHMIIKAEGNTLIRFMPFNKRFDHTPNALKPLAEWLLSSLDTTSTYGEATISRFESRECFFVISPVTSEDSAASYLISYLFIEYRNDSIYLFVGISFIFIALALIVSKIISNYISRPLKQLEAQTLKIAHKEWVEPMVPTSDDEIGSLIHSINFMQQALQQADQEEHRFLQSISHDLKTPIMVIRSHAEAIKDGIYIDSLENTAEIIQTEALRLENKVKQILYYNTLDYALTNEPSSETIDFYKLLTYMLKRFETIRPNLNWELSLKPIMVCANSERLLVAIENILDNQLRYAKDFIRIVLRQDATLAILTISNNGPAIPDELLPHIFKHSYRGQNGQFGLGLAITEKIITFYGGTITVENTSTGVLFRVKIPLSTD